MGNKETKIEKFIKQLNPLGLYDNIVDDIKKYNRADTVNMSEQEMNQFRHMQALNKHQAVEIVQNFTGFARLMLKLDKKRQEKERGAND